jgi:cation transport ATPase
LSEYSKGVICQANIQNLHENYQANLPSIMQQSLSKEQLEENEQILWNALRQCDSYACIEDTYSQQKTRNTEIATNLQQQQAEKIQKEIEQEQVAQAKQRKLYEQAQQAAAEKARKEAVEREEKEQAKRSSEFPYTIALLLLIGLVETACWQFIINTFIGPNKRIGFFPCLIVTIIPVTFPFWLPLTVICVVRRTLGAAIKPVNATK